MTGTDRDPLARIDKLREAIDASIQDLNLVWSTCVDDERLQRAIIRLQHSATNDDIANGRDWHLAIIDGGDDA